MLLTCIEKLVDGFFALIPRRRPDKKSINDALLIAHRGAHNNDQGIIENTLAAFRLAKDAGCWGIEFDIHATADGILVVNHDPTLTRLWHHDAVIANITFSQLRHLAPDIPTLTELVSEFGACMHLFIELKAPILNKHLLAESLKDLVAVKDYHLLSLDYTLYSSLSQIPKSALLLVAVHNNVRQFCDLSIEQNYGGVMGNYLLLTNKQRRQLQEANQISGVGFVNSKNSLYRELNRGIKLIFTNQALRVGRYLNYLGNPD